MARAKRYDSKRRVLRDGEYEHKDKNFYEFRWREVKGYTDQGRKLYKQRSVSAKTLDELRELEEKLKQDKRDGIKRKQPQTLNDYVDKWMRLKRGLKDNTRANYKYMYDKFVRKSKIGTCKIQELKKSDLIEFYTKLVEKGTLSISTCETLQNVIGPACQLCFEEDDLIRRNPASNALKELKKEERLKQAEARARGEHTKAETLTLAEQIRFLDVIKDTVWEEPFTIALCTGLRVGELSGLRWKNIDWNNDRIRMQQNLAYFADEDRKSVREIHSPKTEKGVRFIPITPLIRQMLEKQQDGTNASFSDLVRFLSLKSRDAGIPFSGHFELTPLCNFNCQMCYVHMTKEQMGNEVVLTVDQWKDLICQAWLAGMFVCTLSGGECLVYPGFEEIYLYLQNPS